MSATELTGKERVRGPLLVLAGVAWLAGCAGGQDAPLAGQDWYRWRGPELNGISRETNWSCAWPADGPKRLWRAEVGIGFSSISVSRGRVYTLGNSNATDTVYCLDATTGAVVWQHSYPCPLDAQYYEGGPGATPTVDGDWVYTFSKRGQLFCFAAGTGRIVWQRNLIEEHGLKKPRWGFAGSPLALPDRLVLNAGSAGMAVDKKTGQTLWHSGTDAAAYATPVPFSAGGQSGLLIFAAKALVAVRPEDGRELWRYPWVTKWDINIPEPVVSGSRVFVSSMDRGGAVLDISGAQPKVIWENKHLRNHFSSSVLSDGYLYGIDGNTDQPGVELRCLSFATGELKWTHRGLGLGTLFIANGKLVVLSDKGELVVAAATPTGFSPEARAQVLGGKCWIPPVLSGGCLYCRNAQGSVVCLDLRPTR